MKGICFYISAGKGHYVPAKAVAEELGNLGIDIRLEDFFDFIGMKWLGRLNQRIWRFLLKHPDFENRFIKGVDDQHSLDLPAELIMRSRYGRIMKELDAFRPDFIFATHPYGSTVMAYILRKAGISIPVYYYSTDIFRAPVPAMSEDIRKLFISSEEGVRFVKEHSTLADDRIAICPFPLQGSIASAERLPKAEARRRIGLSPDTFTLQMTFGGEGLGSLSLLEKLLDEDLPLQIAIIGGMDAKRTHHIERMIQCHTLRRASVDIRGFVSNVSDYLYAADIIVSRGGNNTIFEAIYARRPMLITELVYSDIPSGNFVEEHHLGWNAKDDPERQLSIIKEMLSSPEKLEAMDSSFDDVPIRLSARGLAEMVVEDAMAAR